MTMPQHKDVLNNVIKVGDIVSVVSPYETNQHIGYITKVNPFTVVFKFFEQYYDHSTNTTVIDFAQTWRMVCWTTISHKRILIIKPVDDRDLFTIKQMIDT